MKRRNSFIVWAGILLACAFGCGDEQPGAQSLMSGGITTGSPTSTTGSSQGTTGTGSQGCAAGLIACGVNCVDPLGDVENCGDCAVACSSGQQCLSGQCQCIAGLTACSAGCVDLTSNPSNCGSCNAACGDGLVCSLGACSASCANGLTQCGQSCTDTATSLANCGECDNTCSSGQSCAAGTCTCLTGTDCGGVCVDTQTDTENCGACGAPCAAGQACQAGTCSDGALGTGGSSSVGGSSGVGGSSNVGGASSVGGSGASAGTGVGGAEASGGSQATGGAQGTGGAQTTSGSTTTGAAQTTGGSTDGAGGTSGAQTTGGSSGNDEPLSQTYSALATFYFEANGEGACLFDATSDVHVAALSYTLYGTADWCGACAHVDGPNGSTTVRIVDLCPSPCGTNNLDLHPEAWDEIASPRELGQVDIDWYFVPCDVSGPVSYRFKEGTTQWWTAIQVLNHRLPLESLEWSPDGASWSPSTRYDYNYFVIESGAGPNPFWVRITATDG